MDIQIETEERVSFCRFLRTKKMYIPALCQDGDPRLQTDTAHFWCLKTHKSVGPDNDFVHGTDCRAGRSCCETEY